MPQFHTSFWCSEVHSVAGVGTEVRVHGHHVGYDLGKRRQVLNSCADFAVSLSTLPRARSGFLVRDQNLMSSCLLLTSFPESHLKEVKDFEYRFKN